MLIMVMTMIIMVVLISMKMVATTTMMTLSMKERLNGNKRVWMRILKTLRDIIIIKDVLTGLWQNID